MDIDSNETVVKKSTTGKRKSQRLERDQVRSRYSIPRFFCTVSLRQELLEEPEEDIPKDENAVPSGIFDPLDASIQAAQFSINIIDIFDPPKPIYLGKWNTRELKESEAIKLKTHMLTEEVRPFQFEHLLKCIIDRKYVDPACISPSILHGIQQAPLLKLSEEGEEKLTTIDLAGGRHRQRALELMKVEREDKLKRLKDTLKTERETAEKTGVEIEGGLAGLQKKIDDETVYIQNMGKWGVILYDAGTL